MRTWLFGVLVLLVSATAVAGPRLAVLDFEVASGDAQHVPLGAGLRSMLATDLSKAPDVVIVEREQLEAVLAELQLQSGKAVDDKTAVQVGRLLGATHLVDGSVTVAGETMRLDVRLVDVERGTVALGESVEGERLAFFELEKDLVKRVIVGLAVQLAPKQRASIGRVHTADWEAFLAFSQGVSAFDADRYDQAMKALDKAIAADGEFDLADLTQKQYAAIIERLKQREDDLQTAKIQAENLEKSEEVAASLEMIQRLEVLASTEGDEALHDRLTALSLLTAVYREGGPPALRTEIDAFQADRLADHYARRYVAEARSHWGSVRPDPSHSSYLRPDRFERRFATERESITYSKYGPDKLPMMVSRDLDNCTSSSTWGRNMLLDIGERTDRCIARGKVGAALSPDPDYAADFAWKLHSLQRRAGRFDDAARGLLAHAETLDDPRRVKGVRQKIEGLRAFQAAMEGVAHPDRVREVLLARGSGHLYGESMVEVAPRHVGGTLTPLGRYLLSSVRNLARRTNAMGPEPYLLIGDEPLWLLHGRRAWTTGERPDPVRSESLAYFRPEGEQDPNDVQPIRGPALVLYGDRPRTDYRLGMTVHHRPDADWWPITTRFIQGMKSHGVEPGRAPIELVVGARDLRVRARKLPVRGVEKHRPFSAWVIRFDDERVSLDTVVKLQPEYEHTYARETVATQKRKGSADAVTKVVLQVSESGEVVLSLDGRAHRFTIDAPVAGYPGLFMSEAGYARFEALSLQAD